MSDLGTEVPSALERHHVAPFETLKTSEPRTFDQLFIEFQKRVQVLSRLNPRKIYHNF